MTGRTVKLILTSLQLVGCPLTDDSMMMSYLRARYGVSTHTRISHLEGD